MYTVSNLTDDVTSITIKVARLQPSADNANQNANSHAYEQPVYAQRLEKPDYGWPGGNAYVDFPGLLTGWQYSVTFSIETMAESLPILGPRSLILETETLTVPNSNTSAQAWAVHHWVYDLNHGDAEAQSVVGEGLSALPSPESTATDEGPGVVPALTVGWRNVAQDGSTAYNVVMQSNGQSTVLTQTPVTGETVTLTGTNVATLPWCNQAPGGGTETLSVVAVDTGASADVALPPGACYDNGTGIAWVYSWQYFATDHLGTVRAVYDTATGTTQTFAYEPFGVEIAGATPDTCDNTHKFTGHERDTETQNDYMHYRFYAAGMGRFMKPDSQFGSPYNPQGFNLYSYVRGNPVNFNDPLGHDRPNRPFARQVYVDPIGGGFLDSTLGQSMLLTPSDAMVQFLNQGMSPGAAMTFSGVADNMSPSQFGALASMAPSQFADTLGLTWTYEGSGYYDESGAYNYTLTATAHYALITSPSYAIPPPFGIDAIGDLLRGKGYLDFNLTAALGVGITGGIQFNGKGAHLYGGVAVGGGVGGALTYSSADITPGWAWGVQGTGVISFQVGQSGGENFFELGGGYPVGATLTYYYVKEEPMVWGGYQVPTGANPIPAWCPWNP
jgi:RHS repeat-associated protein